jgi:hypothetical protein
MNRIIPLTLAQVGLVLGEPATVDGQVLLAAGTTLTQAHLNLLATRGIRALAIAVPKEQRAPIDTKLVLATDRALRPRFARTDLQHPAMKEIYRLALMRRIQLTLLQTESTSQNSSGVNHAG